jgi:hypothetical protein
VLREAGISDIPDTVVADALWFTRSPLKFNPEHAPGR